jgi:hypothetical protein
VRKEEKRRAKRRFQGRFRQGGKERRNYEKLRSERNGSGDNRETASAVILSSPSFLILRQYIYYSQYKFII